MECCQRNQICSWDKHRYKKIDYEDDVGGGGGGGDQECEAQYDECLQDKQEVFSKTGIGKPDSKTERQQLMCSIVQITSKPMMMTIKDTYLIT